MIMKVKLERTLETFMEVINDIENKITTDDYKQSQSDVEEKISELQALITNYKEKQAKEMKQKVEEKEMKRQI